MRPKWNFLAALHPFTYFTKQRKILATFNDSGRSSVMIWGSFPASGSEEPAVVHPSMNSAL